MRSTKLIFESLSPEVYMEIQMLPEMAIGDIKDITPEEWNEAIKLMKDHNESAQIDKELKGFYYIDVTGKWQVYFTLWRWKDIDPKFASVIKNPIYMGNMTTNFLTSVKKALDLVPSSIRFQIMTDQNREGLIGRVAAHSNEDIKFTFGKYRGRSLGEIYLEDPKYIIWLVQNQDPKYAETKMSRALQLFAQMYYEEVTNQNKEKFKDIQFAGNKGDKYEGEIEVYKYEIKQGQVFGYLGRGQNPPTYTSTRAVDKNGNKLIINNLDKTFPGQTIEKGSKLAIKGKVVDQIEILGVKFTKIGYVKPLYPSSGVTAQVQSPSQPELPIQ